jgi:hypothetical protein
LGVAGLPCWECLKIIMRFSRTLVIVLRKLNPFSN